MNQREPTAAPLGAGQALPCLALLLLLLLAAARAWSRPTQPSRPAFVQEVPYLVALGAPPLRFLEPAPPPDLVSRPAAGAPPVPSLAEPTDAPAAESTSTPAATGTPTLASSLPAPLPLPPTTTIDDAPASEAEASAPAPARAPQPILPDEIRPQARPEDFLPFFQIPIPQTGNADVIVPVPRAPAPLPPSSATYTQTPR
jgi:hypothetical protein